MGTPSDWPRSESRVSSHSIWLSNTVPKLREIECVTSCSAELLTQLLRH